MPVDLPAVLAYDLEIARPLPEGDNGPRWDLAAECGISVIGAWHSYEHEPRIYTPGFGGYERPEMARFLADRGPRTHFVTWNGIDFDDPIISRTVGSLGWTDGHKRVDLSILCGLFAKARTKGIDAMTIAAACAGGVPDDFPVLLDYKPGGRQAVRNGWPLDKTYVATFGIDGSTKSMHGADAPMLWQAGRFAEVIGYCAGDAYRLIRLWRHAWAGGILRGARGDAVVLPRSVL